MAVYDHEEQEQLDALKAWWQDNGRSVIAGVVLVVVVLGGTFGWRTWQHKQAGDASALYVEMQKAVSANAAAPEVGKKADAVVGAFPATAYAGRAQLTAARVAFEAGDLKNARTRLEWVVANATEDELKDIATLRLAQVLIDQKAWDEALKLLATPRLDAFSGLYFDARGDVLLAQGKNEEARAAYKSALDRLDKKVGGYRQVIQLKLDTVGGAK